ncbi:hypothetical protein PILCRDRAFT_737479 [Piloderma croceum F 1598]|uniref:Uncharacterized protein n=1 Tax=Piloderma croceum (strain F 1598) TaxID=765440 RepID=A0A0C3EYK7_PILCF|nr:hypothetical protein PILCRDRAFT_737479 [Piloderma croceum F 1598]
MKPLLDKEANVNASRFPAFAPIIGSSGSTLLHFAAANIRTCIFGTLLLYAARTDWANNHRVIPEMPARETGKEWTAEVLKEWLANKNLDLRECEGEAGIGNVSTWMNTASHPHLLDLMSAPTTSCPRLLLLHILLADNISCTSNEIIISLVLGMVDDVHAQDS